MSMIEYLARCHCGAITARYRTAVAPAEWVVRACQCLFCRSHGALMTSDPTGGLTFRQADLGPVRYRFDSRTADFLLCGECGVLIGVSMDSDKGRFGMLNVLSLRPLLAALPAAVPIELGAESVEGRRLRRETPWTPVAGESV